RNERRQRYGHQTGFRKSHSNLRRIQLGGSRPHNLTPTKMEKVAKFQPDMVKIQFAARIVANLSQSRRLTVCRASLGNSGQHFVGGRLREPP
ncbi:hypothetical protein, partial [Mesorhizobium sp. M7A.F.Ca.US.006.01.2.1]|uniref:hypothetical protein n=1 Tax=Mesorhizobium sp. M7A.F.Ca.US.006.01.2.1 TaxID=2496708 RepID=UPI0019D1E1BA